MRKNDLWDALEDMTMQFAYKVVGKGVPSLSTGGLSALEHAFRVLGWSDPHPCPEGGCQRDGCTQWASTGTSTPDGYKRLCLDHFMEVNRAEYHQEDFHI